MTEEEVVTLMKTSNTWQEWDANADVVINACDGYPSYWYSAIIQSGLYAEIKAKWAEYD